MNIYIQMLKKVEELRKEQLKKDSVTVDDLVRMFYKTETKEVKLDEFEITDDTAIVLLGPSVYGKSTFAKQIMEQDLGLAYCSVDDCSRELTHWGIMNMSNDEYSVRMFGNLLKAAREKRQPVLVDGLWLNIYTRAALFKTLRILGYTKICVIDFISNYDGEMHQQYMMWRALDLYAWQILVDVKKVRNARIADEMFDNARNDLAKYYGISVEDLINKLAVRDGYVKTLKEVHADTVAEMETSFIDIQQQYGLFKAGVDWYIRI